MGFLVFRGQAHQKNLWIGKNKKKACRLAISGLDKN
jgi:hypothetical protein